MSFDDIERRKDRRYIVCRTIEYTVDTESAQEHISALTVNISNSGLCCFTFKPLSKGQEIKIKRIPSQSYQVAMVQWIEKITVDMYRVGLAF
jgi:hypothetical protein